MLRENQARTKVGSYLTTIGFLPWRSWARSDAYIALTPVQPARYVLRKAVAREGPAWRAPRRIRFADGHLATLRQISRGPAAWEVIGLLTRAASMRLARILRSVSLDRYSFESSIQSLGTAAMVRNASAVHFRPSRCPEERQVKRRLKELFGFPHSNESRTESRLLAYHQGGYYLPHFDSLMSRYWEDPPQDLLFANQGLPFLPRLATALVTLSGSFSGGEFVFPFGKSRRGCVRAQHFGATMLSPREAEREATYLQQRGQVDRTDWPAVWRHYFDFWRPKAEDCSLFGGRASTLRSELDPLVVRPHTGSALLFYNHASPSFSPQHSSNGRGSWHIGDLDPCTLHMGCRVTAGHKLILANWLHVRPHRH